MSNDEKPSFGVISWVTKDGRSHIRPIGKYLSDEEIAAALRMFDDPDIEKELCSLAIWDENDEGINQIFPEKKYIRL